MDEPRLNAFIAQGLGISRRRADELIKQGKVRVNGTQPLLSHRVQASDRVTVGGRQVTHSTGHTTILLNKPAGYICSRRKQGSSPTIYSLLPPKYHDLKPAGRLDKDSSGLLILSSDGQLIYRLTHPSIGKQKRYEVGIDRPLSAHNKQLIQTGVKLDDGVSKLQLHGKEHSWLVTMSEGRNRQIRRTFAAVDCKVTSLHRISLGEYQLPASLLPGQWVAVASDR